MSMKHVLKTVVIFFSILHASDQKKSLNTLHDPKAIGAMVYKKSPLLSRKSLSQLEMPKSNTMHPEKGSLTDLREQKYKSDSLLQKLLFNECKKK